jgi:hypothetical protein
MSNVLTSNINGSDCLSLSLCSINLNFNNIDTTICAASSTFHSLNLTTTKGIVGNSVYGIPGIITAYAGVHEPSYWKVCDGSELDRASYTALYNSIGDAFGTPSTNLKFKLPNLQSDTNNIPVVPRGGATISSGTISTLTNAPTAKLTITSNAPSYFGTTTTWPSGYYRVQYTTGGFNLGNSGNWTNIIGYACHLVYSNNSVPASGTYIGVYNTNITQTYTQLISGGQNYFGPNQPYHYDFFHTGGTICIYLYDSTYSDNTTGNAGGTNTGAPIYSLYSIIPTLAVNYIISTSN